MEKLLPMVIAPTSIEFAAVKRSLMPFLKEGKVTLAQCGMGPKNAHAFSEKINFEQISCLILLGWAGGLIPDLRAGDFVIADTALSPGNNPVSCKPISISSAAHGSILTVSKALSKTQEKLQAQTSGALAVEMEAYPLAVKAAQLGVPFIHARIILDSLDETIPEIGTESGEDDILNLLSLLKSLFQKPTMIKNLWQLNARIQTLNPLLGRLGVEVCQAVLKD